MTSDLIIFGTLAASVLVAVVRASTPIILASMGGMLSDLAGTINVALEGIMLVGAFFGVVVSAYASQWFPGAPAWTWPWIGFLAGIAASVSLAGLLAVFHLEFGADLIVAGIGMNILASGLTVSLLVKFSGDKGSTSGIASHALPQLFIPIANDVPILQILLNGEGLQGHHILMFAALLSVIGIFVLLYHSTFGMHLRAVGENAEAALSAGISVKRVRYIAMLLSGLLAGMGGVYLSMGYLTIFQAEMTAGRGFLALAAVFLGGRHPLGTLAASLLFGASSVFAAQLGLLEVPTQVIFMIPPIIIIGAMVLASYRRELAGRQKVRNAMRDLATSSTKKI